jgi:DNA-binding NarL/FixJ family response regulator
MPQGTSEPHDEEQEVTITMLVVDDEPLIRQGLRAWLERVGHITVIGEANNGAEAVALAQTLHPDVVLMDISMPPSDGLAATASLRAAVPHCAVVLLSLYDDTSLRAHALAAGAAALVGKQEGVESLLAAIREAAA